MELISPTPYPDVNEILDHLITQVQDILRNQMTGVYLFGSLTNGDFDSHSDVDVLCVTENEISGCTFSALSEMHKKISATQSPWANQLEVSYIPREALFRYDPSNNRHPHLDRGPGERLHIQPHEADWIVQRHILYKRGITIAGPDLRTLIAPLSPADLHWAVSDILHRWFRRFLEEPEKLNARGYQSYTVLTLCRILYTYENGEIVSKQAAAEWTKTNLPDNWTALIDRAILGRQSPGQDASPEDRRDTLDFIRYILKIVQPNQAGFPPEKKQKVFN